MTLPVVYRPDAVDASGLLARIEDALKASQITATAFGRAALSDPCFVFDLRQGRRLTRRTVGRVMAFLEASS